MSRPGRRVFFGRESRWMLLIYGLLGAVAILAAIVVPAIMRRWFATG